MSVRIALDAMGGDHAPEVVINGAIIAARKSDINILLVGQEDKIKAQLSRHINIPKNIEVVPAAEVATMDDSPSSALRNKKNSSIAVATQLVVDKKADAIVSAGNSGVIMASAIMSMRTLQGVLRPAIATLFPTLTGFCGLLDVGATVECKPKHLQQFGIMGSIYVKEVFGISNPRVGLLTIGTEETKGNELTLEAFKLLSKSNLNFIGNVEGKDIPAGKVDVAICDGFVGNIVLKFGEGVAEMLFKLMKSEAKKYPLAYISLPFIWPALKDLRKRTDYTEYGGAPLLGVDGVCIICHGGSNEKAIANAIFFAKESVNKNINKIISQELTNFENGDKQCTESV